MEKNNLFWTIEYLINNIHLIDFPEYQREPTVWNLEKKQRLIDSIIRDFDIAPIYLFKKNDEAYGETYDCIDGRQRINAIGSYFGLNHDDDDNKFPLTMKNEIYDDSDRFAELQNKTFEELTAEWLEKIRTYKINIVVIDKVALEEEMNLLFLRLNLGQILNAGEKLRAMTGQMRDYVFNNVGNHDFFHGINIPYRRYAKQQVAAQIALNYFSYKKNGQYHRSRYLDLQEFFKENSNLNEYEESLTIQIKERLDIICKNLKDKLHHITNRAIAVSLFLFISALIDESKENEIKKFADYLVKFMKTLKWQIPKSVDMDPEYHYLLDFQTYVTQAAGEKYAIQNRHDFLVKGFNYYKQNNFIEGDDKYRARTGTKADTEREQVKL